MQEFERKRQNNVQRINRHPMTKAAGAAILAEFEAAFRRERAARDAQDLPKLDLDPVLLQSQ